MGGGSLLDLGVYGVSFASMVFNRPPESAVEYAHIGALGSDEQGAALLKYDRGEIVELSFALRTNGVSDAYVFGTNGYIKVDEYFSIPTKATLYREGKVTEVIEEAVYIIKP